MSANWFIRIKTVNPTKYDFFFAVNKEREQLVVSFNWSGLQQEHENILFFHMDTLSLSKGSISFCNNIYHVCIILMALKK